MKGFWGIRTVLIKESFSRKSRRRSEKLKGERRERGRTEKKLEVEIAPWIIR